MMHECRCGCKSEVSVSWTMNFDNKPVALLENLQCDVHRGIAKMVICLWMTITTGLSSPERHSGVQEC